MPSPDFRQLEAVLRGEQPDRPVLFEYFLNERLYARLTGEKAPAEADHYAAGLRLARAFARAGYDHVVLECPWFFPHTRDAQTLASKSLNRESVIPDRAAFEAYPWPDPDRYDYAYIDRVARDMPSGMGIVVSAADGILETAVALVGYENLCYMLYDDAELAKAIFARVGEILARFYAQMAKRAVRAVLVNDDWGYQAQTLLPPAALREHVFPWARQICACAHAHGQYTILHSCGYFDSILPDILAMGFDARHSYEDKIVPVEEAYERLKGRIAVLGGIDVDFLCRAPVPEIEARAKRLLAQTRCRGYALGSGNSIPEYVPDEHFFAMTGAAEGARL